MTRTISKSSKFYKNKSWDLVDALAEKEVALEDLKDKELPEVLQNKTPEAIKAHIAEKKKFRRYNANAVTTSHSKVAVLMKPSKKR